MKKVLVIMITVVLLSSPHFAKAKSLEKPAVINTDEWTLSLADVEIIDDRMIKSDENVNVYSLKITNKNGKKHNVTVHTFRKEQGKSYDFGMSLNETKGKDIELENKEFINFKNFPVGKSTKEFEVVIMWQNEESGRFFKQDFIVPVN